MNGIQLQIVLAVSLLALSLSGCGNANRAPVIGKVTFNGQPVTEGAILFTPQGGKEVEAAPASGIVKSDGTFSLGTEKDADGAAIGRHRVHYTSPNPTGPEWDGYGEPPVLKHSPFEGLVPREVEVEVKPGPNELSIELVAPPK